MASLYPRRGKGPLSIQYGSATDRHTIYLGQQPRRWAEDFCRGVERLVESIELRQPLDPTTARWLADLAPKWRHKLAERGLTESAAVFEVGQLVAYCQQAARDRGLAANTLAKHDELGDLLVEFFTAERQLASITPGDAEEFRVWIRTKARKIGKGDLAATTVTQKCKLAKEYFAKAVAKRWIVESPFADMAGWTTRNKAAQAYVDLETTGKLLAAASPDMQLVIALCRLGGIRTMSETRALEWDWIDFDGRWLTVYSPKNSRHTHKAWRQVPLYPELEPYLVEAAERAPRGARYVLSHGRELTDTSYYNRLERLVRKAGVPQWPSLWNSLRGSKATDLLDQFPVHVVAEWQNDNEQTLLRYYARVTTDHHARAVGHPQIVKELHARATSGANADEQTSSVADAEQMQNL